MVVALFHRVNSYFSTMISCLMVLICHVSKTTYHMWRLSLYSDQATSKGESADIMNRFTVAKYQYWGGFSRSRRGICCHLTSTKEFEFLAQFVAEMLTCL